MAKVTNMVSNLKKLVCDPNCGFTVTSHDESEIVNAGLFHTTNIHNMNLTPKEVRNMIKAA